MVGVNLRACIMRILQRIYGKSSSRLGCWVALPCWFRGTGVLAGLEVLGCGTVLVCECCVVLCSVGGVVLWYRAVLYWFRGIALCRVGLRAGLPSFFSGGFYGVSF